MDKGDEMKKVFGILAVAAVAAMLVLSLAGCSQGKTVWYMTKQTYSWHMVFESNVGNSYYFLFSDQVFDDDGNLTSQTMVNQAGDAKALYTYEYRDDGTLASSECVFFKMTGGDFKETGTDIYRYDEHGNQVFWHNAAADCDYTFVNEYDASGNLEKCTRTSSKSEETIVLEYTYNKDGKVEEQTERHYKTHDMSVKNGRDYITEYEYDGNGNCIKDKVEIGETAKDARVMENVYEYASKTIQSK